jgi:hypothetical protein
VVPAAMVVGVAVTAQPSAQSLESADS